MNIIANLIASSSEALETEVKFNSLYSNSEMNETRIKKDSGSLDPRFIRIIALLKEIHQLKKPSGEFTLYYLLELFEKDIPEYNKSQLIRKINKIGFDKLRDTFERINMECEDYFCESEDLFGIFKRHQFNKKILKKDSDKLRQVIQYIHITLINVNILYKKGISSPTNLICSKKVSFSTIESIVRDVETILLNTLNQHKIIRSL